MGGGSLKKMCFFFFWVGFFFFYIVGVCGGGGFKGQAIKKNDVFLLFAVLVISTLMALRQKWTNYRQRRKFLYFNNICFCYSFFSLFNSHFSIKLEIYGSWRLPPPTPHLLPSSEKFTDCAMALKRFSAISRV